MPDVDQALDEVKEKLAELEKLAESAETVRLKERSRKIGKIATVSDRARFEEEQETKGAVEAPTAADVEVKAGIAAAAEAAHCDNTLSSADALTEVGARVHPNSFIIFTVYCLLIEFV